MFYLGFCHENGKGVKQSFEKAFELYTKSADLGNIAAMFNLSLFYKKALGTDKNLEKSFILRNNSSISCY